jgi:hypothetical protein
MEILRSRHTFSCTKSSNDRLRCSCKPVLASHSIEDALLLTAVVVIMLLMICEIAEQRIMRLLFMIMVLVAVAVVVAG